MRRDRYGADWSKTLNKLVVDRKLSARVQKLAAFADDRFKSELARWHEAADRDGARVTVALVSGTDKAELHSLSKIEMEFARPCHGLRRVGPAKKQQQQQHKHNVVLRLKHLDCTGFELPRM